MGLVVGRTAVEEDVDEKENVDEVEEGKDGRGGVLYVVGMEGYYEGHEGGHVDQEQ